MVAAGLAGASPHMISASITAIGRVVFEFYRGSFGALIVQHIQQCCSIQATFLTTL